MYVVHCTMYNVHIISLQELFYFLLFNSSTSYFRTPNFPYLYIVHYICNVRTYTLYTFLSKSPFISACCLIPPTSPFFIDKNFPNLFPTLFFILQCWTQCLPWTCCRCQWWRCASASGRACQAFAWKKVNLEFIIFNV